LECVYNADCQQSEFKTVQGNNMTEKTITSKAAFELRQSLAVNQFQFWKRLGISQSGGSRYECGRQIPRTVQLLMQLAYGKNPEQALKRIRYLGAKR
jgi:DNA-binding transcriptional regulator YiaG